MITTENLDACEWKDDHREQYVASQEAAEYLQKNFDLYWDAPEKAAWHLMREATLTDQELALVNQLASEYHSESAVTQHIATVSLSGALKIPEHVERLLELIDESFPDLAVRAALFPRPDAPPIDGPVLSRCAQEVPKDLRWRAELVDRLRELDCLEAAAEQARFILRHPKLLPSFSSADDTEPVLNLVYSLCVYPYWGDHADISELVGTSKDEEVKRLALQTLVDYGRRLVTIGYKSLNVALFGDPLNTWVSDIPLDLMLAYYSVNTPILDATADARHRFTMGSIDQGAQAALSILEQRRDELASRPWMEKIVLKDVCSFLILDECTGRRMFEGMTSRENFLGWLNELCEKMLAAGEDTRVRNLLDWAFELEKIAKVPMQPDLRLVLDACARKLPPSCVASEPPSLEQAGLLPALWKRAPSAGERVHALETCLHRIVVHLLEKAHGERWWREGVPAPIRVEAVTRRELEDSEIPAQAYLTLLDHKSLIEKNWGMFADTFADKHAGKTASLKWLLRLNDIRNRVAHSTKMLYKPINADEEAFLDERLAWLRKVAVARGLSPEPSPAAEPVRRPSLN